MKNKFANRFLGTARIVVSFALLPAAATAGTFYWDTNPNTVAAGNNITEGGAGTWNNVTANFTTSATDDALTFHNVWSNVLNSAGKDTVIFAGSSGGAVTLDAFASGGQIGSSTTAAVNNLTFSTTGYTLAGTAQLRFVNNGATGGSITVNPGITATISNAIQGTTSGALNSTTTGADGAVDTNVAINGGGTLRLGGGNGSLGFSIAAGTTVEVFGGTFSGFNLSSLEGTIKTTANNVLPAPSSLSGTGAIDLNNTTQTISTIGGSMNVLNSAVAAQSITLSLTLTGNAFSHTGVISNSVSGGVVSLATVGTFAQGNGFNTSIGFATQTLAGANTFTGSTSLGRGNVTLDFSNASAPLTNILYNTGFGTPSGDDGKLVISRPLTTINGFANSATGTASVFTITGKASSSNIQQFNGLKVAADAAATVLLNPGTSPGTMELNLGSTIERSSGGLINFATTNANTALSATATIASSAGSADTILLDASGTAFATLGGRDWAAKNTANNAIVPAIYTTSTPTTLSGVATTAAAGGSANDVKLVANTAISALRYSNATRTGISLGGNTLTTGGILISNASGTSGSFISSGTLKPTGTDLVIANFSGNTRAFGVKATVADGTLGATGLTTGGTAAVYLTSNNSFTGALNVQQNALIVTGTNTPSVININGSTSIAPGTQLPGNGPNTTFLQLGNANALGSVGAADINLATGAMFAIKRSDSLTLNNNTRGLGGITQGWSGTTTLVSAAAAKYGHVGDTTVTAGTLKLDYAASNTGILSDSTRLVLGGGTVEYATAAGTTQNDALRDTILISGASTVTKSGAGAGRLRFNSLNNPENSGGTLNLSAASIADTDTTNTNGILGSRARYTVANTDWALNSTNAGDGPITAFAGYTDLAAGSSGNTTNFAMKTPGTTSIVLSTADALANSLKIDTAATGGASTLTLATSLTLTSGGVLVTGPNAVAINTGTLKSNTGTNSDLIIHQHSAGGLTIGSVIANGTGASTLTKTGSGSLTLSNANTYTGNTFLNGGTTIISNNANVGAPASGQAIQINNATLRTTADIILSNGAVGTNNRAVTVNGIGGTLEVDDTTTLTVGGNVQGPGGLTKTGTGTLDVRNLLHSGPTTISAGTLKFGAAVFVFASDFIVDAAGTLDLAGTSSGVPSLSGSGTVTSSTGTGNLSIGTLPHDSTFSGKFTGTLSVEKYGAGTLTLTTGTHDYTGATNLNAGGLTLTADGALPPLTNLNAASATSVFDVSTINSAGTTIGSLGGALGASVILGDKNLLISGTTNTTFAGSINGTTSTITIDRSATATQTFSGANVYDGVTTINKGILAISHNSALGSTVGNTVINSTGSTSSTSGTFGGQLSLSGGITIAENITVQGSGDAPSYQRAIASTAGENTINGTITLDGNSGYRIGSSAGTLNLGLVQRSGANSGTVTLDPGVGATVNVNIPMDNNGGSLIIHAGGTAVLNASGNDLGSTTVQNSSTLKSNVANALPSGQNLTVGQGSALNGSGGVGNDIGVFFLNGGNQTVNSLNGFPNSGGNETTTPNRRITSETAGGKVLTIGFSNGSGTFDGVIEDGSGGGFISLVKNGSGTQTLTGTEDDTYTGDTTINGGTLVLDAPKDLADGSTVRINGLTSVLQLPAGVTDIVNALLIDGVPATSGLWGSTASGAPNVDDDHFSGTGKLSVQTSGDYSTWASGFGVGGPAEDDDKDGLTNQQEYAFGLIPNSGASVNPFVSLLDKSSGLFTYTRRKPSLTGLAYTYEYSTTLEGAWIPFTADSESSNNSNPVEAITVDMPNGLLGNTKLFIRVVAQ